MWRAHLLTCIKGLDELVGLSGGLFLFRLADGDVSPRRRVRRYGSDLTGPTARCYFLGATRRRGVGFRQFDVVAADEGERRGHQEDKARVNKSCDTHGVAPNFLSVL